MMEILFRGKRIDNNEWVCGYYCRFGWTNKEKDYIIPDYASACTLIDIIPESVCQYTGLKDKNDRRIFEGDIIEGGYLNPMTNEFLSRKYVIEYKDGVFNGKLIGHSPYGDTWLRFLQGEIIGNIHDNPELLK